ncbi:hypothetical protein Plec18167_008020 [Paecilomyces lecythidis]|uniref:PH domain-containing protein n=1 Tax=Paecilomyces lecythidis TaxID=3004212 RepID=A0ABR3WZH1_9EURO
MAERYDRKERRKSLSVLSSSLATTANTHDRSSSDGLSMLKKKRRNSSFFSRNPSPVRAPSPLACRRPDTADSEGVASAVSIPITAPEALKLRRKSLQRSKRASVFGSLRSLHSQEDDDKSVLGRSKASSEDNDDASRRTMGAMVLHHGEVQTTGGMWRKKNQYLVLTDTHLVRLKNQNKAAEMFPSIPSSHSRPSAVNRQSVASIHSLQEVQVSQMDAAAGIPLNTIVAVYRLDDSRPSAFTVEVAYIDERTHKPTVMQMQLTDPEELNLWLMGVRSAAETARSVDPFPFDKRSVEYVVRMLQQERDYDPEQFHMFRAIQRSSSKSVGRASSDDLSKLSSTMCYVAIGMHKIHLIPLQKITSRASMVSLNDLELGASFGLMNLTGLAMQGGDDSFSLSFRVPLRSVNTLLLASVHSGDIALWIRQITEFLRPLWLRQPFDFLVPRELDNIDAFPPVDVNEDYGCFDRTLIAYSASYDIDTSNIRYTVDHECEDAPCFKLLPPASAGNPNYSPLELLAVMRALRYNESFRSISFSEISLDVLQRVRDIYGLDVDAQHTRAGTPIKIPGQEALSLLSQEIRALALKSKFLRRLDFSYCLSRPSALDKGSRDSGCGIPEAIFPICRRQLTNVDWVVLNGIKLGDSDLDYLVDAASQKASHFRALEISNCGLSVHDLDLVLSTVTAQEQTLEAISIAGVQGRLSPELFQPQIGYFAHIRKIDLSRVSRTSGPEPLIAPETLLNWRLEVLSLSQTAVNEQTVDSIAAYLASDRSRSLRELRLDQCGLTATDVAVFLQSMSNTNGKPRNLHLHVNENRIDSGCSFLFDTIAKNQTPTHLSMRMIDFKKEEHFAELVEALRKNSSLKYLDISKASLPYDAGPETCKALQLMFEDNQTLEELDISGEYAHLDVARFGIGLNLALTGLKKNRSLKVLRLEHQKLGLQGANTLASVLEENTSLREIYCENNDINLQSFTVLVNGLQRNRTLLNIPTMDRDRNLSLERVRREIESVNRDSSRTHSLTNSSLRRSLHAAMSVGHHTTGGNKLSKHKHHDPFISQPSASSSSHTNTSHMIGHDVQAVLDSLNQKWDAEVERLRRYLFRNYSLANGSDGPQEIDTDDAASDGRPTTAASLGTMLQQMKFDLTQNSQPAAQPALKVETVDLEDKDTESSDSIQTSPLLAAPEFKSNVFSGEPGQKPGYRRPASPTSSTSPPSPVTPSKDYTPSSIGSPRLALPLPAIAPSVSVSSSIRSTRTSSTVSTNNGVGVSTKSHYGLATSSLRGFLSGRGMKADSRKLERVKDAHGRHVYITSDQPPQLDWSLPKLDGF